MIKAPVSVIVSDDDVRRAHAAWIVALGKLPVGVEVLMTTEQAQTALRAAIEAVAAQQPADMQKLVIAARRVAYEDQSADAIKELDKAVEAFAAHVPWEDDPNDEGVEP